MDEGTPPSFAPEMLKTLLLVFTWTDKWMDRQADIHRGEWIEGQTWGCTYGRTDIGMYG